MRELKTVGEIIQQHFPLPKQRGSKRWCIAETRKNYDPMTIHNEPIEAAYRRIIKAVKTLYLKPGEVYFERDYKHDKTEGMFGMHCLVTPNFYWRLDCLLTYNYQITYAFTDCNYEAEIRKLLATYPLDRAAMPKPMPFDYKTFYISVIAMQDASFIHSFKR